MDRISAVSLCVLLFTALLISVRSVRHLPDKNRSEVTEDVDVTDPVPVFANKVFSDEDPCVTIPYSELPFCPPGSPIKNRKKSLEEILEGDCFTNTRYELNFKIDKHEETVCEKNLTKDEIAKFRYAVKNVLSYHMYYNGIQLESDVGYIGENLNFLFKHITFEVFHIGNQIQDIQIVTDFHSRSSAGLPEGNDGKNVKFTYSVFWKNLGDIDDFLNTTSTDARHSRYSVLYFGSFIAFCILYSVMVFSVIAFHIVDYFNWYFNPDVREARRYARQIHGEACRCPPYSSLLGATLGIGTQQLILFCALFVLVYKGYILLCSKTALLAYLLVIYWLTSAVSGYIATSFYSRYTAAGWKECVFQTGTLYLVPASLTFLIVNDRISLSDLAGSNYTALLMLFSWGVGTFTFVSVGGMMGHTFRATLQPRCGTSEIPRVVNPQLFWYTKAPAQVFLGGLLPFLTIFWGMDDIYASLWNHKVCGAFSTLLTHFIVIIVMTVVVAMCSTYIRLGQQYQQWAWRSVFRGGSAAIFMYAYCIYFHVRANKIKPMELLYFLGCNACIFHALFLVLGTISFHASQYVFRRMHRGVLRAE
ncbi:transmembrane 9 superfamily member 2-like [Cornus florida]|uniref:transmembrane 9 superfamily member 2-like n=1 Tax=Cornus florida TaxID=4283 RepID=UPI00289D06F5|nr:transmembrane 9 superfamily member 2-like [Cornus florida]